MTLITEPRAPERSEDLAERDDAAIEQPPATPDRRIRWFEWATGAVVLVLVAIAATFLITQGNEPQAEADSTLVIGPRHFGVVYVPEYVGQSGGDLTPIESSPLVIGVRHLDGVVFLPEYVGHADGTYPEDAR